MSTATPPLDLQGYNGEDGSPAAGAPSPMDWAYLVLGAARRRPWVMASVFLLGLGAATTYYVLRTPLYRVETRILAQRQQAVPTMIRPSGSDEAPTRTAAEFVHQRDNLLALIRETNLVPAPRADGKAPATTGVFGVDDDSPLNTLVVRLDRALTVTTGDGVITISIDWNDPQQAYHLVEAALQNFLEARQIQEITAFDEAISLMQGRAAELRQQVEKEEARDAATRPGEVPVASAAPATRGASTSQTTGVLARLNSLLGAKERALRDLEEARRRRLLDLQAQLDERRGVYSDAHPNVIALRREIEAFARESPQLVALREEEARLREEYNALLPAESRQNSPTTRVATPRVARPPSGSGQESERVREARGQYQHMLQRVNEANLALDTARAAFKYRYTVIRPAEVPRLPIAPMPSKVFGLGGLASLVLGLLAAAWPDLRAGRIVERWQVERILALPILAELRPRAPR